MARGTHEPMEGGMDMPAEKDMDMDHGFMVAMEEDGDAVTITFTVPLDVVGEWTIGCFEEDGDHWDEGMRAKFIVEQ